MSEQNAKVVVRPFVFSDLESMVGGIMISKSNSMLIVVCRRLYQNAKFGSGNISLEEIIGCTPLRMKSVG